MTMTIQTHVQLAKSLGLPVPRDIGGGLHAIVATVTPAMAANILEYYHDPNNRRVKIGSRNSYVNDMRNGKFTLTHQAIAFTAQGMLFDGQHRLNACVVSAVNFDTVVIFGIGQPSVINADIGIKRSIADVSRYSGESIPSHVVSIIRCLLYGTTPKVASPSIIISGSSEMSDALEFISPVYKKYPASIVGAIARAYYHEDRARLGEFMQTLVTMIAKKDCDTGAIALAKLFIGKGDTGGGKIRCELWLKTMAAVKAYCDYRPITHLRQPDTEIYALPEDVAKRCGVRTGDK